MTTRLVFTLDVNSGVEQHVQRLEDLGARVIQRVTVCTLCAQPVGTQHEAGCPVDGRSGREIEAGVPNMVTA